MRTFTSVPIVHLLAHPTLFDSIELYIQIAEKHVKLNFADEPFKEILQKLQKKGATHIYLSEEDLDMVLHNHLKAMSNPQDNAFISDELNVSYCEMTANMAREFISKNGASSTTLNVIEESSKKIQSIFINSPGLSSLYQRFKYNCSEEFLKINITNFISCMIANQFTWSSPAVNQKLIYAGFFSDLILTRKEFDQLHQWEDNPINELPERIKKHPLIVSQLLIRSREAIPPEALTIIEQHHEKPNGKGFPLGIPLSRFNKLSAIYIVSKKMTDGLFEHEFEPSKYKYIVAKIYKEYEGGPFTKALEALEKVLDVADNSAAND